MAGTNSAREVQVAHPMLEWHDLTVAYGRRPVLWNVDFEIQDPCLFGSLGPMVQKEHAAQGKFGSCAKSWWNRAVLGATAS